MDEMNMLANLQGRLLGVDGYFTMCYFFFTEDNITIDASETWLPYKGKTKPPLLFPDVVDHDLQILLHDLSQANDRFYQLNASWTKALLLFFKWDDPKNLHEWHNFRKTIDEHRKLYGASWMQEPFSQKYEQEMQELIARVNYLMPLINQKMIEVYQEKLIDFDHLGDQRAKDLIDEAEGEADLRKAIELLNKAVEYGESGIQASKAFINLGMRYEDIGEIQPAINFYSKALNAWKPSAMVYFWRGRLYYQLGQWDQARRDFKQALAFPSDEGLYSPEYEEAEQYLIELKRRPSN